MILNYLIIKEDILVYCKKKGYKIIKLNIKNYKKIWEIMNYNKQKTLFRDFRKEIEKIWADDPIEKPNMNGVVGRPDFFIYKKNEYWFVEYKTFKDSLSKEQILWFFKNPHLPIKVIHSLKTSKNHPKSEILNLAGQNFTHKVKTHIR